MQNKTRQLRVFVFVKKISNSSQFGYVEKKLNFCFLFYLCLNNQSSIQNLIITFGTSWIFTCLSSSSSFSLFTCLSSKTKIGNHSTLKKPYYISNVDLIAWSNLGQSCTRVTHQILILVLGFGFTAKLDTWLSPSSLRNYQILERKIKVKRTHDISYRSIYVHVCVVSFCG